jgi:hypothetical protein
MSFKMDCFHGIVASTLGIDSHHAISNHSIGLNLFICHCISMLAASQFVSSASIVIERFGTVHSIWFPTLGSRTHDNGKVGDHAVRSSSADCIVPHDIKNLLGLDEPWRLCVLVNNPMTVIMTFQSGATRGAPSF